MISSVILKAFYSPIGIIPEFSCIRVLTKVYKIQMARHAALARIRNKLYKMQNFILHCDLSVLIFPCHAYYFYVFNMEQTTYRTEKWFLYSIFYLPYYFSYCDRFQ
jgi:hypothetical protein